MRASNRETIEQNRRGWDKISASYQAERHITTDDVHYGPNAPGERALGMLREGGRNTPDSVRGKMIVEIGCGGGQNAIALSRWGARCTGVDPSAAQLVHAQALARAHGVEIGFLQGIAEDLGGLAAQSFDIALSSYAFDYVTDLDRACAEAWRVLRPGGLFVFCLSHPWFQAVGWHLAGDPDMPEIGHYATWPIVDEWDWQFQDGTTARLRDHLRPLAQIINTLIEAGFVLERLVEQAYEETGDTSPEVLARFPYRDGVDPASSEYRIACKLPRTLILRARKMAR